jgi:beta-glucosidase
MTMNTHNLPQSAAPSARPLAGLSLLALAMWAATGCATSTPPSSIAQPELVARGKPLISMQGLRFKDLNANGTLEPYEDWRLTPQARAADLVARMTLQERAGMMLIETLNAGCAGALAGTRAEEFVQAQKMTRFILRSVAGSKADACDGSVRPGRSGHVVTPGQLAAFTNAVQALAEAQRLGIPVQFKDNARNHRETDARFGITAGAGVFTEFPKEAGIAAAVLGAGSTEPVDALTRVMAAEWRAVGLRGMYGYMADLATEPRWYRVHETFTENADLAADIMRTLVLGLQGGPLNPRSAVALTIKHFPGGGPQELGLDPHYSFGKRQVYPAGRFEDHLKPFRAAIDAGVSAVMPYYGVPVDLKVGGQTLEPVGFAFSHQVVTGLLRGQLGFKGYVNSDTGIINDRAWGLEDRPVRERVAAAINGGTDILSGFSSNVGITDLVAAGLVSDARITEAAQRLLVEQFQLGLFENPYVDEQAADSIVGRAEHKALALQVHRQSLVLLQNLPQATGSRLLPLAPGARVYALGLNAAEARGQGYTVTEGQARPDAPRASAAGHDVAVVRIRIRNVNTGGYRSQDPATGANPALLNPLTGKPWGAADPCNLNPAVNPTCSDDGRIAPNVALGLFFGGALPWEADALSFTRMAASKSWEISPSLADIRAVMQEVGAARTVLSIDFRNPYVLDEASGLRQAGALLAEFGGSDRALLDVLSGRFKPQGRLPFALANNVEAIRTQQPDAPGYAAADTLFPYGFGLRY